MKKIIFQIQKFLDKVFNKPIPLNKYDVTWIKLFKYHYREKLTGSLLENMKIIFTEIYGWNPDEDNNYNDFLRAMYNKLVDIYMKIGLDESGNNVHIKDILSASFSKSIVYDYELPIERVIFALISKITNTKYLNKYGNPRFLLDKDIYNS